MNDIMDYILDIVQNTRDKNEIVTFGKLKDVIREAMKNQAIEEDRRDKIMGEFLAPDMFDNG